MFGTEQNIAPHARNIVSGVRPSRAAQNF